MRIIFIGATALLLACTSTYHPEYHPVTVTTVHQVGGSAPASTVVLATPTLADPDVFFHRQQ